MPGNRMKMKKLLILGLLLVFACDGEETEPRNSCHPMISVSDASPIQFWPVDCETWNQSRPPGVHHYCFCHPWQCGDEIKTQFLDDSGGNYLLKIFDEDDSEIDEIEFTETVDPNSPSESIEFSLSSFTNEEVPLVPGAIAWSLGSNPTVSLTPSQSSKRLSKTTSLPAGTYKVMYRTTISPSIDAANVGTGLEPLHFLDGDDVEIESIPISNGTHIEQVTFLDDVASMHFRFVSGSGSGSVTINSLVFVPIGFRSIYSVNLIPNNIGICDQKIRLSIFRGISALPPFSEWHEESGGGLVTGWTISNTPSISIPGPAGAAISKSISGYEIGHLTIHWKITVTNTGISVGNITFYKLGVIVSNESTGNLSGAGTFEGDFEVDLTDIPDEVRVDLTNFAANTKNFVIDELQIIDSTTTPTELYKSDCLDIKALHSESLLIDYTNHTNYAGIEYGTETPDPSFSIRIPAVFFETRFPQEGEDFQTSSNEVFSVNNQIKEQRLLSTDRMPTYMHRKIIEILNHQFLYIDGEYWVKGGENYEKKEKSNKRDSFDMYTCWLTRQNFVVRNIL